MPFIVFGHDPTHIAVNGQAAKYVLFNGTVIWQDTWVPYGCTELAWLQTSTEAWYETIIIPGSSLRTVFDGMIISGDTALYGARIATSNYQYAVQFISSGNYRLGFGYGGAGQAIVSGSYPANVRHIVDVSNQVLRIDGNVVATTAYANSFSVGYPLYVAGALNTKGTASNKGVARLFSMQCYLDEELIADFRPILDNQSRVCLYDIVSNSYLYHSGTGSVTYEAAI